VSQLVAPQDWWNSLRHSGLLLDRRRLSTLFPGDSKPPSTEKLEKLRETLELGRTQSRGQSFDSVDFLLTKICGFSDDWKKGPQVDASWSRRERDGAALRPERLWTGVHGEILPVFFDKESKTIGLGKGRRVVSRVLSWMRAGTEKLAVLTNGRQWRIVYAGLDHESWCESDSELWFQDGQAAPQLHALIRLLSPELWRSPSKGEKQPLLAAIEDSRKGQADLSSVLGEHVRHAVEQLIDAHQIALDELGREVPTAEIYRAAVRMVMRLVVILFAEARGLLPVDNTIYHAAYGLRGLQDDLAKVKRSQKLSVSHSAWPRLLALFRLVHEGCPHPDLPVHAYGGELFQPAAETASEAGILRAVWIFENACFQDGLAVADTCVDSILSQLTRTTERIRSGTTTRPVSVPVDFSDLSSEYIGILYEGLLGYELKQVPEGEVAVPLPFGQEPVVALSRLIEMTETDFDELADSYGKAARAVEVDEEEDTDEFTDYDDEGFTYTDPTDGIYDTDYTPLPKVAETSNAYGYEDVYEDDRYFARHRSPDEALSHRLQATLVQTVKQAKWVTEPGRNAGPERMASYQREVEKKANALAKEAHFSGKRYLVRWGGTRKGSGSFYTRPGLSIPTVIRTLAPLAYDPPKADSGVNRDAPLHEWTPRKPEEILALKVCDPACGSGTFPVGVLRFLTQALWDSVHFHKRVVGTGDNRSAVSLFGEARPGESLGDEFLPCLPDDDTYEPRLRARLKRHVAERCIYGVDLDPLAVELCRLALWIETLDPELPFTFLNHKIKWGNGLVGCWFDRFEDYPAMAFYRPQDDAGDGKGPLSQRLKAHRDDVIKPSLKRWLEGQDPGVFAFMKGEKSAERQFAEITALFSKLHDFPVHEAEARARFYGENIEPALAPLRFAFDAWCALWFWPLDRIEQIPSPENFGDLSDEAVQTINQTAASIRFFHWELEFPDVFNALGAGFDAMVGNPPWETLQPTSKEWFANHDPLYPTYGKQDALQKQKALFAAMPDIEKAWVEYCGQFKSLSNWCGNTGFPCGDPEDKPAGGNSFSIATGRGNARLHGAWRQMRLKRKGYSDSTHVFRYQGEGKPHTYKLFLEQMHNLLRRGGRLGVIVPSNLYTDKGTSALRGLFLDQCRWEWLFGFENREKVFDIDSRFKFCPIIIQKGGRTEFIRAAFMRRSLSDWGDAEQFVLPYRREQVDRFSPKSRAILELRSMRDAEILEKMYSNGVLLGDNTAKGWGIQYRQGDFNMTSDSKLFPPRPKWEAKGYVPDEYGHWLQGKWQPVGHAAWRTKDWETAHWNRARSILRRPDGVILSRDGMQMIHVGDISDVALPLYEGRMIDHFDFSAKGWVSGKGRSAKWREIPWEHKVIEPQFLIGKRDMMAGFAEFGEDLKTAIMDICSATNARTAYCMSADFVPFGHSAPTILQPRESDLKKLAFAGIFNSLCFDHALRIRLGGLHLTWHYLEESALPKSDFSAAHFLSAQVRALNWAGISYALRWINHKEDGRWRQKFALTTTERCRRHAILESLAAHSFGLDAIYFLNIMSDCDHPAACVRSDAFTRALDPKGFWRVDKEKDPELRHTVLAQVAFADLQKMGLEAFLSQNNGEGWMLPETLRLADYGLGQGDYRASQPQPVASRLGPRFYDWQLEGTIEESWEECRRHADLIKTIRKH
jgi:hypothetical protein